MLQSGKAGAAIRSGMAKALDNLRCPHLGRIDHGLIHGQRRQVFFSALLIYQIHHSLRVRINAVRGLLICSVLTVTALVAAGRTVKTAEQLIEVLADAAIAKQIAK